MNIKIDDLLAFCAYYPVSSTKSTLPFFCPPPASTPQLPTSKKKPRDTLEPKRSKIIKPKLEYSNSNPKKNTAVVHQFQEESGTNYDINYFVSHMASNNYQSSVRYKAPCNSF